MLDALLKIANARQRVDPTRLKSLGRRASQRFLESDGGSLTEAVTSIVREEGDLSRDQIRRVTEAANQATWSTEFVEGGNRETNFDPANGDDVLSAVTPDAPEAPSSDTSYDHAPAIKGMDQLLAAFGAESSDGYDSLDPDAELRETHEKTSSAHAFLQSQADLALASVHTVGEELYQMIKQAHLQGEKFPAIIKSVGFACMDQAFAEDILKTAAARMQTEGIKINMEKIGHVEIVRDHPLVKKAAEFETITRGYFRASEGAARMKQESAAALQGLRDSLRRS